jgi:DNA-binding NarL/FixJ family response regulator
MKTANCVLLANRHLGLAEGMHGLLGTLFKTVVMVADEDSLQETADRLHPDVAVVDLSLARQSSLQWLQRLHERCPDLKLVVLSAHDESSVRQASLDSGADGFVLKRSIGTDLLPAIESVLDAPAKADPDESDHRPPSLRHHATLTP